MSFSFSEERGRRLRRRLLAAAACLVCVWWLTGPQAGAGEATARGKKANIIWIDEAGVQHEEAARDIEYGYVTRVYLNVPKDGKKYKDEVRQRKGLPLGSEYISFSVMDRIELDWGKDETTGASRLNVKVIQANGKIRQGGGTTLAGASHPASPYFTFTVGGEPRRIEILPMSGDADRAGKPRLVAIQFVL